MKITDVTLTPFAWDNIRATNMGLIEKKKMAVLK